MTNLLLFLSSKDDTPQLITIISIIIFLFLLALFIRMAKDIHSIKELLEKESKNSNNNTEDNNNI